MTRFKLVFKFYRTVQRTRFNWVEFNWRRSLKTSNEKRTQKKNKKTCCFLLMKLNWRTVEIIRNYRWQKIQKTAQHHNNNNTNNAKTYSNSSATKRSSSPCCEQRQNIPHNQTRRDWTVHSVVSPFNKKKIDSLKKLWKKYFLTSLSTQQLSIRMCVQNRTGPVRIVHTNHHSAWSFCG